MQKTIVRLVREKICAIVGFIRNDLSAAYTNNIYFMLVDSMAEEGYAAGPRAVGSTPTKHIISRPVYAGK